MSQTTVNELQGRAIAGQKLDLGYDHVVTRRADSATVDIGVGAVEGTTFYDVVTMTDVASLKFKGFTLQSHDREASAVGSNSATYIEDDAVNVMTQGGMVAQYTDTPAVGDDVWLAAQDGGKVTNVTSGTIANNVQAVGWIFVWVDAALGLAGISNQEL